MLVIDIPKPPIENRRLRGTDDARPQSAVINLFLGVLGVPWPLGGYIRAGGKSELAVAVAVNTALTTLITKYGYTRESARDLVGSLASMRYRT